LAEFTANNNIRTTEQVDFFEYWESLGFFEYSRTILPANFFILFEIARVIYSDKRLNDALSAIEELSKEEILHKPDRKESIQINRLEKISPLSDRMEISPYRNIIDLKKALPRELALDDDVFDVKLYTKTLLVQRYRHPKIKKEKKRPASNSNSTFSSTAPNQWKQK
jgi:hypothetical protein